MMKELVTVAQLCDGVRCDMAMLILPPVFESTWGRRGQPFWSIAIPAVRDIFPAFLFLAKVYWDMEWTMQQEGFDYAYDKRLYDRLLAGQATGVHDHFFAALEYQNKLARFLENHDERRIASALENKNHEAAAIITFLSPGLRFFHQGQFDGRQKRISPHLVRGPKENPEPAIQKFYTKLLNLVRKPVFRSGQWQLLQCIPAWEGNDTSTSFIAFAWMGVAGEQVLVSVNYAAHQSQCFVQLPFPRMSGNPIRFTDSIGSACYDREGDDLLSRGLFLDLPPWGYHVFEVGEPTGASPGTSSLYNDTAAKINQTSTLFETYSTINQ